MRGYQYVQWPPASLLPRSSPRSLLSRFRYYTDRLITAKDHAAIQISVADVDENGVAQGTSTSFAISGPVRAMGESDDSLNRLATKAGRESLRLLVRSVRNSDYCRYFPLGFLVNFVLGFFDFSAQKRLVVSEVDIGSCPPRCTHAIEALFFLHLEFCEPGGLRAEVAELRVTDLLERSTFDLPAAAVPSHPHITSTVYSDGRRKLPNISLR